MGACRKTTELVIILVEFINTSDSFHLIHGYFFKSDENLNYILVKVLNAVDVVGSVHSERDAIQAAVAHHTSEAVRMVGFPRSPQDALHDGLTADGAGLKGVL